jgi:hypothetical protein
VWLLSTFLAVGPSFYSPSRYLYIYRDYAPAPELDHYDARVLARDDDVEEVGYEQMMRDRRAAEEELDAMDARRREMEEDAEEELERVGEREQEDLGDEDDDEEDEEGVVPSERALNLEAFDCPLREWIAEDRTRREIQRRFKIFLTTFYPDIEQVTRWKARYVRDGEDPPPLPANLRVMPPVYLHKIK